MRPIIVELSRRVALVALAMLVWATPAAADFDAGEGDVLVTLTGGYFTSKLQIGFTSMGGGALHAGLEKFLDPDVISVGLSFAHMRAEQDLSTVVRQRLVSYTSTPIFVAGRYYLGYGPGAAYIGLGAGVQFAGLEEVVDGRFSERSAADFMVTLPVGFVYLLPGRAALTFSYTGYYVSKTSLIDDVSHTFNAGVGFHFRD